MCYWVGTKKVREEMGRRFNMGLQDEITQLYYEDFITNNNNDFKEYYVAMGKGKPIITALIKNYGKLQFQNMQWTLPYSYFDKKTNNIVKRELQNSTCERVFLQHKDIIYRQRCLIPIDGYFEYYHFRKETYPYYIHPTLTGFFYAGGIWDKKVNEQSGEITDSFSIITTPANSLTGKIHNKPDASNGPRMLLLINHDEALKYLDEKLNMNEIKNFFKPYDEKEMTAHTVLRFQRRENSEFLNTPKVQEYYEYPELAA